MNCFCTDLSIGDAKLELTMQGGFFKSEENIAAALHCHSAFEVHYIRSGTYLFFLEDRTVEFSGETLVMIAPKEYHKIVPLKDGMKLSFQFRILEGRGKEAFFEYFTQVYSLKDKVFSISYTMEEFPTLLQIISQCGRNFTESNIVKLNSILTIVFLNMAERLRHTDSSRRVFGEHGNVMVDILAFIQNNYADITLKKLANYVGLSTRQTERIIKMQMNETFLSLLNRYRAKIAVELIQNSGLSMEAISMACGFSTYSGFWKIFQRYIGCSPSEIKRKNDTESYYVKGDFTAPIHM